MKFAKHRKKAGKVVYKLSKAALSKKGKKLRALDERKNKDFETDHEIDSDTDDDGSGS